MPRRQLDALSQVIDGLGVPGEMREALGADHMHGGVAAEHLVLHQVVEQYERFRVIFHFHHVLGEVILDVGCDCVCLYLSFFWRI